jgi:hypothetical protein
VYGQCDGLGPLTHSCRSEATLNEILLLWTICEVGRERANVRPFCSVLCCLKGRGQGKGPLYVPSVQTCERRLTVNKTDTRVVFTCISSSHVLHQIHHTRLIFGLLLEGDADLSITFFCLPTRKRLFNFTLIYLNNFYIR